LSNIDKINTLDYNLQIMVTETLPLTSDEIVAKFGGSSVDNQRAVGEVLGSNPDITVAVVSGPKNRQPNGDNNTDILIRYGRSAETGKYDADAHEIARTGIQHTFRDLGSQDLDGLVAELDNQLDIENASRGWGWYASVGENISARGGALLHDGKFVDSLVVCHRFGGVDYEATNIKIKAARASGILSLDRTVFHPGYYGRDGAGNRVLLGRGGSDRVGVLVSIGLDAINYNMTDVDGIFSGNPKLIKNAKLISQLARREVREGAHGGSGVLQGDTIIDLEHDLSTLVYVRNTFNPGNPGTLITAERNSGDDRRPIVAVSGRRLAEISVEDMGMANAEGYIARVAQCAAQAGISLELAPSAQDGFSYTVAFPAKPIDEVSFRRRLEAFRDLVEAQTVSLHPKVEVNDDKGVLYLVGDQLRDRDVAGDTLTKALGSLRRAGIGWDASIGHPTSPSLALLVNHGDVAQGLQVLHRDLIERRSVRDLGKFLTAPFRKAA
jgi:aspartate kinase